jgi:hypothetical protein
MKRKPTSKIYHTALYLHHVCGKIVFTCRELHEAQWAARDHYHSLIPASVLAKRDRLLIEHNHYSINRDWDTTKMYHARFHPEYKALQAALRKLFKPYIWMDDPTYSSNIFSGDLRKHYERGYLVLIAIKPFRTYCLPDSIINHPKLNQEN